MGSWSVVMSAVRVCTLPYVITHSDRGKYKVSTDLQQTINHHPHYSLLQYFIYIYIRHKIPSY